MRHLGGIVILLGTLALPASVSGCQASGGRSSFDTSRIEDIRPGQTTREAIVSWFGPPETVTEEYTAPPRGAGPPRKRETFTYSYLAHQDETPNGPRVRTRVLSVTFGPGGRVQTYSHSYEGE